jgi:hypothetical protein
VRITTPAPGYTGTGPGAVEFRDGAADIDLSTMDADAVRAFRAGPLAYYRDHGYGIDGEAPAEAPADPVLAADPREVETVASAPLRDAAVDPRPGDFLTPTNAGEPGELGNPHGPHVVSPGIHGSNGPVPPLPGPVSDDPAVQEAKETGAAHAVLVDGAPVGDVIAAVAERAAASDELDATDAEPAQYAAPAHSAAKAKWVEHATRLGADPEEAEQLTKAELIDQYDRPAPNPAHKAD